MNDQLFQLPSISRLPTKENAAIIGRTIAQKCLDGDADTLQTYTQLKAIAEAVKLALDELSDTALDEVRKHGKAGASILSAKLEEIQAGIKYDYSGCPKWRELNETCKTADADRKDREKFLRGLSKPIKELDESTAEMIEVFPPVKTYTETVKVTLADK